MTVTVDIALMARTRLLNTMVRLAVARQIGDSSEDVKSLEDELRRLRQELARHSHRIVPGIIELEPNA